MVYQQLDPVTWRTNIMQVIKQHADLDQAQARRKFLQEATGLTLYGCSIFEFQVRRIFPTEQARKFE